MPFIPDFLAPRYASPEKCPHCGTRNCTIYDKDPDDEHTEKDISFCDKCGDYYKTDEGAFHVVSPNTWNHPEESVNLCPKCGNDPYDDDDDRYDPEDNGWPR